MTVRHRRKFRLKKLTSILMMVFLLSGLVAAVYVVINMNMDLRERAAFIETASVFPDEEPTLNDVPEETKFAAETLPDFTVIPGRVLFQEDFSGVNNEVLRSRGWKWCGENDNGKVDAVNGALIFSNVQSHSMKTGYFTCIYLPEVNFKNVPSYSIEYDFTLKSNIFTVGIHKFLRVEGPVSRIFWTRWWYYSTVMNGDLPVIKCEGWEYNSSSGKTEGRWNCDDIPNVLSGHLKVEIIRKPALTPTPTASLPPAKPRRWFPNGPNSVSVIRLPVVDPAPYNYRVFLDGKLLMEGYILQDSIPAIVGGRVELSAMVSRWIISFLQKNRDKIDPSNDIASVAIDNVVVRELQVK